MCVCVREDKGFSGNTTGQARGQRKPNRGPLQKKKEESNRNKNEKYIYINVYCSSAFSGQHSGDRTTFFDDRQKEPRPVGTQHLVISLQAANKSITITKR